MTEAEFKEFLEHKAFKQDKVQKKLKKKAMIKRLRKRNFDLEREVRRSGLKRKLRISSSSSEEDHDKTMTMDVDNNNPDNVLKDIDSLLASSSEETEPLVRDNSNWMQQAKKLNREERQSVSDRFSAELRLMSSGHTSSGYVKENAKGHYYLQGPPVIKFKSKETMMRMRKLKVKAKLNVNVMRNSSFSGQNAVSYAKKDIFIEKKDISNEKKDIMTMKKDITMSDHETDFKKGAAACGLEVLRLEGSATIPMTPLTSCTF